MFKEATVEERPKVIDYRKLILPCSRKFITRKRKEIDDELQEIEKNHDSSKRHLVDHDHDVASYSRKLQLKNTSERYRDLLERKDFIPTGNEILQLGNGVEILIDGNIKKTFFFENTAEGSKHILSVFSPLGKLLNLKKVGFKGTFNCNMGADHEVEILRILPYTEAKKILKS